MSKQKEIIKNLLKMLEQKEQEYLKTKENIESQDLDNLIAIQAADHRKKKISCLEAEPHVEKFLSYFNIKAGDVFVPFIHLYYYYRFKFKGKCRFPASKKQFAFIVANYLKPSRKMYNDKMHCGYFLNKDLNLTEKEKKRSELLMDITKGNVRKSKKIPEREAERLNAIRKLKRECKKRKITLSNQNKEFQNSQ